MTSRPNILFIAADDLNGWIGALGRHPQVRTPNIDRLARRGTMFSKAYCNAPYCNSSRMAVFTGKLPATSGIYHDEPYWTLNPCPPTYIERLRAAGYHCEGAGKVFHGVFDYPGAGRNRSREAVWYEKHAHEQIWDRFHSPVSEPLPPARPLNSMFDFSRPGSVDAWNWHFDWGILPDEQEAQMPDSITADRLTAFLADPPAGKPFFAAAGFYKPHLPWYVPKRFFDLYPLDEVVLPVILETDLDDVPDIARRWALTPNDHENVTKAGQWRHAVQGYLAAISYSDAQIGRLLDALDASPAHRDTLVVLWGDNGFHLGEKLHWRKFVLWEEATLVPLVMSGPGLGARRVDTPVGLVDLFPTLFELCGLPHLPDTDGRSLLPLVTGAADARPAVTTWHKGNHSIRFGSWRYTRYEDGSEELYDQACDPLEWTNLAGQAAHSGTLEQGRALLHAAVPAG